MTITINDKTLNVNEAAAKLTAEASLPIVSSQEEENGSKKSQKLGSSPPATTTMFEYQDEALDWMKIRELDPVISGGFLCHEMGLGKTRMMSRLIKDNLVQLTLVLTTKSTIGSWLTELRTQSNFAFDCLEYKKHKTVIRPGRPTVLVATHHSVLKRNNRRWIEEFGQTWFHEHTFNRIVVDEAHILRNFGSLFADIQAIPSRIRWGITATPYNNRVSDIRAYTQFLNPGLPTGAFKHYMCRRRRSDVVEGGPQLISEKHIYDFETEEENQLYDYVSGRIDDANAWIQDNARRLPRHVRGHMKAVIMLRQRQAAIHPQMVLDAERVWRAQMPAVLGNPEDLESWDPTKVTKFRHIIEMIKQDQANGHCTMVVTHFKLEIDMLYKMLRDTKIRVEVLNGKTKPKDRAKLEGADNSASATEIKDLLDKTTFLPDDIINIINDFVGGPRVLLLQIRAGGVGISLPWVNHVINTSPDWNPFLELQAIYRAYRINTKHDVRVTSMYFRDTIDTDIQTRQVLKFQESLKWTGDAPESISEFIRMPV